MNTSEQHAAELEHAAGHRHAAEHGMVTLAMRAIAELCRETNPAIAYVELDWSDQPDCTYLIPLGVHTADGHELDPGEDVPAELLDELLQFASVVDGAYRRLWAPMLMPHGDPGEGWRGPVPPNPPRHIRLYVDRVLADVEVPAPAIGPLYAVTVADVEAELGRPPRPGEAERIAKALGFSSIPEVVATVLDQFRDMPDEPEER